MGIEKGLSPAVSPRPKSSLVGKLAAPVLVAFCQQNTPILAVFADLPDYQSLCRQQVEIFSVAWHG
jgi:hypothetical protein